MDILEMGRLKITPEEKIKVALVYLEDVIKEALHLGMTPPDVMEIMDNYSLDRVGVKVSPLMPPEVAEGFYKKKKKASK